MVEQTSRKARGRKLTKEQKAQVLQMALQAVSVGEIARQMDVDVLRVSGTIRSAKNTGALPPDPAPDARLSVVPPAAPSPAPAAAPPALSGNGGHAWSRRNPGGDFSHPAQTVKYLIERLAPQNDGLVGSHASSLSDDEVGRQYGHGSYRISKQIPGRIPEYRELDISRAFGEPRWPRDMLQSKVPQRPAWLTKEQTERVIQLARRGVLWGEIARQMGIDAGRVHGTIIAVINSMLQGALDS